MAKLEDAAALTLFAPNEVLQPQLIPVEINLEGWPLFSRQKTPEDVAFEVGQSISTDDGRRLDQVWRVTASADFSLPGPFDEDVFVGVMALVKQRGGMPQDGRIRFSLYELIKVLGKNKRGGFHEKVRESLDRMASTIYYSKNAFYVLEDESLETYRFTLWTVHFSNAKGKDGRGAEHHTLKFDDIIMRSYNAGYLKLMDTDLYFRLKIPLAKALYRLVDQRRRGALSWSVDVRQLRDLLVMSKSYKAPSRIWEVLGPAHRALRREKFLESATIDGNTARYRIHPDFACDWYPEDAEEPTPSLHEEAVIALKQHGVWPKRARALVDRFGPEKAFHVLDVVAARGGVENRGSYVAEVMEKGDPEELKEMAQFLITKSGKDGAQENYPETQLNLISSTDLEPEPGAIEEPDRALRPTDSRGEDEPTAAVEARGKAQSAPELLAAETGYPEAEAPEEHPPSLAAQEAWRALVEDLTSLRGHSALPPWWDDYQGGVLEGSTLTVLVPNSTAANHLEGNFGEDLLRLWRERAGPDATLEMAVSLASDRRAPLGDRCVYP